MPLGQRTDQHNRRPSKPEMKHDDSKKGPWKKPAGGAPRKSGKPGSGFNKSSGNWANKKGPHPYKRREIPTKNNMTHDELMMVWEKMRVKKLPPPERLRYINSVIGYFVDNVVTFSRKPVEVRILRFIVKHGTDDYRSMILKEVSGHVPDLIVDKYATKLIERLGGSYRWDKETSLAIVESILPNIQKLCLNTIGATTISYIYQAMPLKMQNKMLIALVGPAVDITDTALIARETFILKEALYVPGRFNAVFSECIKILHKGLEKNLIGCTLLTKLAADTLRMIFGCFGSTTGPQVGQGQQGQDDNSDRSDDEDNTTEPTSKKTSVLRNVNEKTLQFVSELTDALLEENAFLSLLDTADSVFVSSFVLQFCTPKYRKDVIKAVRPNVVQFASDPMAFILLCKLFAVTDDTVTTISSLISGEGGIGASLNTILRTRAGIRIIYFLLFGLKELDASGKGSTPIFAKWISEILRQTDLRVIYPEATIEQFPGLCKKDGATKQAELRMGIMPFLLSALTNEDLLVSLLGSCEVGSQMLCELIAYLSDHADEITKMEKLSKSKGGKKGKVGTETTSDDKLQPILEAIAKAACKLVDTTVRGIRQTDKDLLHQGSASNIMKTIAKQQKKAAEMAKKEQEQAEGDKAACVAGDGDDSDSEVDSEASSNNDKPAEKANDVTKKGQTGGSELRRNAPYVPCAPEDMQPLFRHDVGYFSVRRILTNHPPFGALLLTAFENQNVQDRFFADKRGAFMLEHIAKISDKNKGLVNEFVSRHKLTKTITMRGCKGSEALCTVLGL